MRITATALLVFAAMSLIVVSPLSLGNVYALLDKDDRYVLATLENVKSRDVEVTVYIYDEHKDKKIQGNPDPVDTASTVKHKFKLIMTILFQI